jgi:hypothetical protein
VPPWHVAGQLYFYVRLRYVRIRYVILFFLGCLRLGDGSAVVLGINANKKC